MRSCSVRPSVCLSGVRYVRIYYSVETSKIPSASHTTLVFLYQTLWQYSDGDPVTGENIVIFDQYMAFGLMTGVVWRVANSFDRGIVYRCKR